MMHTPSEEKPGEAKPNSTGRPVLRFRNVTFGYTSVAVVEDVTFTVREHNLTCIVGPNGGGKSTLLKLALGLLHPDKGEIRVLGDSPESARRRVGYMPQYVHYDPQFPVTVMAIVLMGRLGHKLGGRYSRRDKTIALQALDEVGIADLRNRLFAELSGGQRQRVLIARALACEPELLLLDEPTSNIDAVVEEKLLGFLQQLNERLTVVMATHDLGFVSGIVDYVICVNRRAVMHPTSEVTGDLIRDMYSAEIRAVRHGQHVTAREDDNG